ncbi:MIIP-like protein [Mya arenaria]|uniref:MIIP-like protein n=1 Tax=Mya arenaria TaxID=6604 RepID=A0ABY7F3C3_MYAAR|nr:MIIP-like protein [Mya arenaria]
MSHLFVYNKQPGQDPVKRTPVRRLGSAEKKNVKEKLDTSLEKSVLDRSGREGRARLHKKRSKSKENRPQSAGKSPKRAVSGENKENYYKNSPEKTVPEKVIDIDKVKKNGARSKETNTELEDLRREIEEQCGAAGGERKGNRQQAAGPTTPNTVRKRRIIDQNVKVSGVADLNASELLQECEADFTRLNYSYSGIDDNDLQFLSKRLNAENEQPEEDAPVRDTDTDTNPPARYSQNLSHPGNSRKIASFIKESKKPKSILLANNNSRLNKSGSSRVSFRSPTRDSSGHLSYSMDAYSKQQHKMLGYDWIAALMDNDPAGVNQSETFFDELKEFRKLNLEECVNKHCMMGFNTSKPAMVPASSNIALRDATSGIKSAVRTTLDDAETLAANFPYEWDPKEQSICRPLPRPTYKPESSYADSSWPAAMKSQSLASCLHTSSNFQQTSQNLQKATDELLDSTYSLMYEMKRLKTERSDHPIKL